MKQFDVNKYTGIKRKIAIELDSVHISIKTYKGIETRGIVVENFNELIDNIYYEFAEMVQIHSEINEWIKK